jgi:hypothetical protein
MLLLFFSGRANNRAFPTGVAATGQVGTTGFTSTALVPLAGVQAFGRVGAAIVPQPVSVPATGVQALGVVNGVIVWGRVMTGEALFPDPPSDIWTEIVPKDLL